MGTFLIIAAIVGLVVWAYVDSNSLKATLGWGADGVKGVGSDLSALRAEVQMKQLEDPNRQQTIKDSLNATLIDTYQYKVEARARSLDSHTRLRTRADSIKVTAAPAATPEV